jgi:hypothetical protein
MALAEWMVFMDWKAAPNGAVSPSSHTHRLHLDESVLYPDGKIGPGDAQMPQNSSTLAKPTRWAQLRVPLTSSSIGTPPPPHPQKYRQLRHQTPGAIRHHVPEGTSAIRQKRLVEFVT